MFPLTFPHVPTWRNNGLKRVNVLRLPFSSCLQFGLLPANYRTATTSFSPASFYIPEVPKLPEQPNMQIRWACTIFKRSEEKIRWLLQTCVWGTLLQVFML